MATPLKIKDANGNIQQLTTTDENYVAYQVGLHLSTADSAEVGSLNRSTGGDTVGTFSNTFFNQPVGTHPSTSITTGTTKTTVYQTNGTAAETNSNVFTPVMWVDSSGSSETGFKMMPSADLNEAVDRYLSKIFTNEYPGSYRLSTAAPSGDWTEQQTAFTDTRADGTSVAYKIWKKTSGTAPTTVRPLRLKDESSFAGIQAMTDTEIKWSFGQRAKTRIAATNIGSYQLRNSGQGAPTDTGTWVAKGTATDTKQTTSDQVFTRDSTTNFQAQYVQQYTKTYTTNFTRITPVDYVSFSSATFSADYSRAFTGQFSRSYTSTFSSAYERGFVGTAFNVQYEGNFTTQYIGTYETDFIRNTDVAYNIQYLRRYTGNYLRTFIRNTDVNYARTFDQPYVKRYTGNYLGTFIRNTDVN